MVLLATASNALYCLHFTAYPLSDENMTSSVLQEYPFLSTYCWPDSPNNTCKMTIFDGNKYTARCSTSAAQCDLNAPCCNSSDVCHVSFTPQNFQEEIASRTKRCYLPYSDLEKNYLDIEYCTPKSIYNPRPNCSWELRECKDMPKGFPCAVTDPTKFHMPLGCTNSEASCEGDLCVPSTLTKDSFIARHFSQLLEKVEENDVKNSASGQGNSSSLASTLLHSMHTQLTAALFIFSIINHFVFYFCLKEKFENNLSSSTDSPSCSSSDNGGGLIVDAFTLM